MNKPLISVVTPAYNVESCISETIISVLAQTFTDFEYLIIDDGSTDNTVAIANSFACQDTRIRVISQTNRGCAGARNTGVNNSQGEYISFVDGDDIWHPDKLMLQLKQIQSLPKETGAVFSWSELIDENGLSMNKRQEPPLGKYDFNRLFRETCPQGNASCLLIRKQCFEEVGLFDETLSGPDDFEMWLRIAHKSHCPYFYAFSDVLVKYRQRLNRVSTQHYKMNSRLQVVLNRYSSNLTPQEKARVFIKPALLAFRAGGDEHALQWSQIANNSGFWYLLRSSDGRFLLLWSLVGKNLIRQAKHLLKRA
jgi:glycosyltransferase involved in cell wall biosynthesis